MRSDLLNLLHVFFFKCFFLGYLEVSFRFEQNIAREIEDHRWLIAWLFSEQHLVRILQAFNNCHVNNRFGKAGEAFGSFLGACWHQHPQAVRALPGELENCSIDICNPIPSWELTYITPKRDAEFTWHFFWTMRSRLEDLYLCILHTGVVFFCDSWMRFHASGFLYSLLCTIAVCCLGVFLNQIGSCKLIHPSEAIASTMLLPLKPEVTLCPAFSTQINRKPSQNFMVFTIAFLRQWLQWCSYLSAEEKLNLARVKCERIKFFEDSTGSIYCSKGAKWQGFIIKSSQYYISYCNQRITIEI